MSHSTLQFQDVIQLRPEDESKYLMSYLPLVKRIVKQLAFQVDNVIDRQDMEQIALMGLLESLRRYGHPDERFASYAIPRIRGAILDELRLLDWRPRRLRQKTHKINDAIRELSKKIGKEPSYEEINQYFPLSIEEYQEYLLLNTARSLESLDDILSPETLSDALHSRNLEEEITIQNSLKHAVASLDQREQLVLSLYYEHELSLKEIALVLDLTEARVCQLNKIITDKIKKFFSH